MMARLIDLAISGMAFARVGELLLYYLRRYNLNQRDYEELSNYWGE